MSDHNKLEEIMLCVCDDYGITKEELLTVPRQHSFFDARLIFFNLALVYATKYDVPRISKWSDTAADKVNFYTHRFKELLTYDMAFRKTFNRIEYKYLNRDFHPYNLEVNFLP